MLVYDKDGNRLRFKVKSKGKETQHEATAKDWEDAIEEPDAPKLNSNIPAKLRRMLGRTAGTGPRGLGGAEAQGEKKLKKTFKHPN